ncbi:hypothetical protein BCR35DRAFT_334648 [Leucosporidium creatinivorum]|uniref:GAR domain-containing protein n=1 Tax=Leucosporidium creatinivorum TaxID=106004 RepID=A0A1Y2DZR3_9BASI|nr:hypothetical protein BCR35DRAFT_334648 [Leucosporidium creatinivorum]
MSLRDEALDSLNGSIGKKKLFSSTSSSVTRTSTSPKSASLGATDDEVERGLPLESSGLGLGLKGLGGAEDEVNGAPTHASPSSRTVRHSSSKDELALLILSSGITELSMSIQDVNTLIFEIQELRHTTAPVAPPPSSNRPASPTRRPSALHLSASASTSDASRSPSMNSDATDDSSRPSSRDASAPSQVDAALMRLEAKLEIVAKEYAEVESQAARFFGSSPPSSPEVDEDTKSQASFLRRKWKTTVHEWTEVQKDAEILGEELKEDKWIVVFRTVSVQAEEMMRSLEKVLTQSHDFVYDIKRRKAKSSASSLDPSRSPPANLTRSASSSFFGDPASIQPLLSSFVALHQSLHAKVKYYSPACDRVLKILGKGIADRKTKNGEVLRKFGEMKTRWRDLLERITRIELEMRGVEDMLRESAGPLPEATGARGSLPTSRSESNIQTPGGISPFRRLANKVTRSSPNTTPTSSASRPLEDSPDPARPATASGMYPSSQTPPRPPKSTRRLVSGGLSPSNTPPRTPLTLTHRRSASAMNLDVPGSASTSLSSSMGIRPSRRAPSPAPSANGSEKPRWNISTKRGDERETLRSSISGSRPPLSMSASSSSLALSTGRTSALGMRRPSSRQSNPLQRSFYGGGGGAGGRPVSPAFSDASSSFVRDRPSTPSRIPIPASATRRMSTGPFSSLDDPEPSSLLQRAMSPTPSSTSAYRPLGASRGASSSRNHLSTPGGLSPPRASSPTPSSTSTSFRYRAQTPEPNLMAQAKRMSNVRLPQSSLRTTRPPVPTVPSSYRRESLATPRPSSVVTPRRPSTALSSRTEGVTSPTPTGYDSSPPTGSYTPNPIDPLDVAVSQIVNSLPLHLDVERVDPPFNRIQVAQAEILQAKYYFTMGGGRSVEQQVKPLMCKLVDKVGPRASKGEKKVLVRVGTGWQGLDAYGMSLLATSV